MLNGANIGSLKRQNRSLVLRTLLERAPLSRSALGRLTGLSPSTITNMTGTLIAHGLVREAGSTQPGSGDTIGRPPVDLTIAEDGGHVLGVYLGARVLTVSLGNLRARVLGQADTPLSPNTTVDNLIDLIETLTTRVLAEQRAPAARIFGVGITAAGPVDPEQGVLRVLANHPWTDVRLADLVRRRLPWPVAVEESRRAMALAETTFGSARDVSSLLVVHVATTVGCGIVIDRRPITGDHFAAGSIGHVVVDEAGEPCSCGSRGCLETIAGGDGIIRLAREAIARAPSSTLAAISVDNPAWSGPVAAVFQAARDGDDAAIEVVHLVADALGRAIATVVLTLDPQRVIVTGSVSQAGDLVLQPLRATVHARTAALGGPVDIRLLPTGPATAALPGLALALQTFVYSPALRLPEEVEEPEELSAIT